MEYSQSLKKKGKNLSDICESDFFELLIYFAALYKQFESESGDSYGELMDQSFEVQKIIMNAKETEIDILYI